MTQNSLSQSIHKEYNKFVGVIAAVPPQQRLLKVIDGTGGKVSVADIIAYQIGWGNLLINWYTTGLTGKKPIMPGEGFTKWDYSGIAQHFYKKYHYDGYHQQEQEFHNVVTNIVNIVETEYQFGNLDKIGVWDWCTLASGKQWPLSKWITVNTVAPYKRATALIKKTFLA